MAIVNHEHRFIFIHVYKTGGTSIRSALPKSVELQGTHATAPWTRDYIDPAMWYSYTKFAVVRNPFDWMISLRGYIQHGDPLHWAHDVVKGLDMMGFLQWHARAMYRGLPGRDNGDKVTDLTGFLCDEDEHVLVDRVLRFENLSEEFEKLSAELKLPERHLPYENASTIRAERGDHRSHYTAEARDYAEKMFARDFRNFGYAF